MSAQPGYSFKLYVSTALIVAAGTGASWSELDNTMDLDIDPSIDALDATTRGSGGRKEYVPGLLDVKLTWKLLYDTAIVLHETVEAAFYARTILAFNLHSGDRTVSGTKGIIGNYMMSKFKTAPPIDGLAAFDCEAMPAVDSFVQRITI